jgi:hypothetical protein
LRNANNILVRKPEGRDHSEDLDVDGKIIEWIFRKWVGKLWTGYMWLRRGTWGGLL